MQTRYIAYVMTLAVLLFTIGCGSSNTSSNPGTAGPGNAGSGTSNPGGSGSTATIQLAAETNDRTSGATGQITVDSGGKGALTLHSNSGTTGVTLSWCNFPGPNGCFSNFVSFGADANGNVNGTFTFPAHGNFAGTFGLTLGGTDFFESGWNIPNGSTPFQSTLLKASSVGAGLGSSGAIGSDPLSSGLVSIAAGSSTVHTEVHGASPSQSYSVVLCGMGSGGGCETFGNLSTDGSGNGSGDFAWTSAGLLPGVDFSGVFLLRRANGGPIEFVNGFHVP